MNKRKMIFAIVLWVLLILIIIAMLFLKWPANSQVWKSQSGGFNIWIVWDSVAKFNNFLDDFKKKNPAYSQVNYSVTSFPSYEEYTLALNSAFIQWKSPDMFVLNNNEISLFEEKIRWIPNDIVNIDDFRKNYKGMFIDDLVLSENVWDDTEKRRELLKWMPIGYEVLGIFYNKWRGFKLTDFAFISYLEQAIQRIKERGIVPLAIWNGSAVKDAWDILNQFYMLHGVKSLAWADSGKTRQALAEYMRYWEEDGDNAYNTLFEDALAEQKNNIDFFANKEVAWMVAYPRAIEKLHELWSSKKTLFAAAFPYFNNREWYTLANYNYFVINAQTTQQKTAFELIKYMNSDTWSEAYFNEYTYYLPARITLEEKMRDKKIMKGYDNIILWDFYSDEHDIASFNKGNKAIFDKDVVAVLDDFNSYIISYKEFRRKTLCYSKKILTLENLSSSCE